MALILVSLFMAGCAETTRQAHVVEINHYAPRPSATRAVIRGPTRVVVPERDVSCRLVTHPDSDGLRIEKRVRADLTRIGADKAQIEAELRKLRRQICS